MSGRHTAPCWRGRHYGLRYPPHEAGDWRNGYRRATTPKRLPTEGQPAEHPHPAGHAGAMFRFTAILSSFNHWHPEGRHFLPLRRHSWANQDTAYRSCTNSPPPGGLGKLSFGPSGKTGQRPHHSLLSPSVSGAASAALFDPDNRDVYARALLPLAPPCAATPVSKRAPATKTLPRFDCVWAWPFPIPMKSACPIWGRRSTMVSSTAKHWK